MGALYRPARPTNPPHEVRMRKRSLVAVSTFALFCASGLQAQKPVAVEGGLFGQFTKMDAELAMDDVWSIGGRLGLYVLFRNFAIEVDGQYGKTDWAAPGGTMSIDFMPVAVRGVYGIPLGERLRFLLGSGTAGKHLQEPRPDVRERRGGRQRI